MGTALSGLISDPPPSSPIVTPEAVPATTLPLYPGLGQAPNMLACILNGMVSKSETVEDKQSCVQLDNQGSATNGC